MTGRLDEIRALIAVMDGDDHNAADEAMWGLKAYGAEALEPLLAAAPSMGRFGQLSAIDLLDDIGDPRAATVLIPMLRSEDGSVREWAAGALGRLGATEAIPELRRAYDALLRHDTPLDWTEPETLRRALTKLGARREVLPERVRELRRSNASFDACWAVEVVPEVVEELAAERQVVLQFMFWQPWRDSYTWTQTPRWEPDWSLPFDDHVRFARDAALDALRRCDPQPAGTVATLDWIDAADLEPST